MKRVLNLLGVIFIAFAVSASCSAPAMEDEFAQRDCEEISAENLKNDEINFWAKKIKQKKTQDCDGLYEEALSHYLKGDERKWKEMRSKHRSCVKPYQDKARLLDLMIEEHKKEKCGDFHSKFMHSTGTREEFMNYLDCAKPYDNNGLNIHRLKQIEDDASLEAQNKICNCLMQSQDRATSQFLSSLQYNRPIEFTEQLRSRMIRAGKAYTQCKKKYQKFYISKKIKENLIGIEEAEQHNPETVEFRKKIGCEWQAQKWMFLYENDRFSGQEESQATKAAYKELQACGWLYSTFIKAIEKTGFFK